MVIKKHLRVPFFVEMAVIARCASAPTDTPRLKTVHRTVFLTAVSITFYIKKECNKALFLMVEMVVIETTSKIILPRALRV